MKSYKNLEMLDGVVDRMARDYNAMFMNII